MRTLYLLGTEQVTHVSSSTELGAGECGDGRGLPGGGGLAISAPILHCRLRCSLGRTCLPSLRPCRNRDSKGSQSLAGAGLAVTRASGITAPHSVQEAEGEERHLSSGPWPALASFPPRLPVSCSEAS